MAINNCVFMGNLGADPVLAHLPSGKVVANFSIACGRRWKDKQTGELKEETDWFRCVAFNKTAEMIGEYFKKGSQIHVTTQARTRSWESEGAKHYITEFLVRDFQFCGNRQQGGISKQQANDYSQGNPPPTGGVDNFDGQYDDDIPF